MAWIGVSINGFQRSAFHRSPVAERGFRFHLSPGQTDLLDKHEMEGHARYSDYRTAFSRLNTRSIGDFRFVWQRRQRQIKFALWFKCILPIMEYYFSMNIFRHFKQILTEYSGDMIFAEASNIWLSFRRASRPAWWMRLSSWMSYSIPGIPFSMPKHEISLAWYSIIFRIAWAMASRRIL